MKCPKCKNNHKYSAGMRCTCGYGFVFNPKTDRMTDGKFVALLKSASGPEGRFFTENQLYAQFCRGTEKTNRLKLKWALGAAMVAGAAAILLGVYQDVALGCIFGVLALIGLVVAIKAGVARPPDRDVFSSKLGKWRRAGGDLAKLLTEPRLGERPPDWQESDIYDYGVERLLVVQHDILVDLFVLNGLAAEEKALVIAESGYPRYLLPIATKVLNIRPDLPVLVLHDSTQTGMEMGRRLKESGLLPLEGHPLVDIGLSPENVKAMPGMRAMGTKGLNYEVPVDFLLYPAFAKVLAASFVGNVGLAVLLQRSSTGGVVDDRLAYSDSYG